MRFMQAYTPAHTPSSVKIENSMVSILMYAYVHTAGNKQLIDGSL